MQTFINVGNSLLIIQNLILTLTLIFIAYQFVLQRKQMERQKKLSEFELYYKISEQYLNILRRAIDDPVFNKIWEPIDAERVEELDEAQKNSIWGAWHCMNDNERKCYRYTRDAVETFERAFQVRNIGILNDKAWEKWLGWMSIWKGSSFFEYVFQDSKPRLIEEYCMLFASIEAIKTYHYNKHETSKETIK